jgi:glycosyltransferase involved in cell wall biosynthesis
MIPMYLPVKGDAKETIASGPLFFGGINTYLQQKSAFFRRSPRWIDRLFDSPKLLTWIGRKAGMTSARHLGQMTISMLRAEQGRQVKELHRLVNWLGAQDNRPDVVCLSNILLAGLARPIKERLDVPVACLLQDEDGFVDGLTLPYAEQAWQMLAERSSDVDAFIAVSRYFGDVMRERLAVSTDNMHVVHAGISLDGYKPRQSEPETPAIGYLSRMCADRGLDTLVEAFIMLKKNERLKDVKLKIAGGKIGNDEAFVDRIRKQLVSCGLIDDVGFLPDFDRDSKLAFFQTLSLLSVPEKKPIAYGLYVIEALAAGVPVVEPASGAFVELLEMTGGGVLFEPNDAAALASAMEPLLLDPDYARQLGEQGREAVFEKFNVEQTVQQTVRIYEGITQ